MGGFPGATTTQQLHSQPSLTALSSLPAQPPLPHGSFWESVVNPPSDGL